MVHIVNAGGATHVWVSKPYTYQVLRTGKRRPEWQWLKDKGGKSPGTQEKGGSEERSESLRWRQQRPGWPGLRRAGSGRGGRREGSQSWACPAPYVSGDSAVSSALSHRSGNLRQRTDSSVLVGKRRKIHREVRGQADPGDAARRESRPRERAVGFAAGSHAGPLTSDLPVLHFRGLFPSSSFSRSHSGLLSPVVTACRPAAPTRRLRKLALLAWGLRGLASAVWRETGSEGKRDSRGRLSSALGSGFPPPSGQEGLE